MEQKLKIQVPEGCTAKIEQQGNCIVVVVEQKKEEKWVPKDGDIYTTDNNGIGIYNANYKSVRNIIPCYCGLREDGLLHIHKQDGDNSGFGYFDDLRPATEEEKQRLFDALAKEGKRWNPETKQIEDLPRWRAKEGGKYYFVSDCMDVDFNSEDSDEYDDSYYEAGNYFKTEEAAERAAEKIRKILKESEAE